MTSRERGSTSDSRSESADLTAAGSIAPLRSPGVGAHAAVPSIVAGTDDSRSAIVARVSAAFAEEIDLRDPAAPVAWPLWPTVAVLIEHLGRIHLWAAEIIRTGNAVDRGTLPGAPTSEMRQWYEGCRESLLSAFAEIAADQPCWVIGDRIGSGRFWRRRMVYETVKHLIDLRASGGGEFQPAPELEPVDYADGIDELFEVYLPRSRATLSPLPGVLTLAATDIDRRWTIARGWGVNDDPPAAGGTVVRATVADLALLVWERAYAGRNRARYGLEGSEEVLAAFASAPIHP